MTIHQLGLAHYDNSPKRPVQGLQEVPSADGHQLNLIYG